MSLKILYVDEMTGFAKSKVMITLWLGMPVMALLMHFLQPNTDGMPIALFVSLLISVMGGMLSTVMLSSSIISEKNQHVYDIFLVRPVRRWTLLMAKYLAVLTCLVVAVGISVGLGLAIDAFTAAVPLALIWESAAESLVLSIATIAVACSVGVLLGVIVNSVAGGVIGSIYGGSQLSVILMMPSILIPGLDPMLYSIPIGCAVTLAVLSIAIVLFNKKQF